MTFLIPSHAARSGDDPIFALNRAARARALAGEPVINATVGALLDDEGKLSILSGVAEALRAVPAEVSAGYAPIAGPDDFLRAVVADLFEGRPAAASAVAIATPGGSGALRLCTTSFLEPGQTLLTTSFYWGPYKTLADEAERKLATFRMFDEQRAARRGRLRPAARPDPRRARAGAGHPQLALPQPHRLLVRRRRVAGRGRRRRRASRCGAPSRW